MSLHYLVKHNICQSVHNHINASIKRHGKLTVTDKHITTNVQSVLTRAAVATAFRCLSPQFLSADSNTDEVDSESATSLAVMYSCDLSDELETQLLSVRALFKDDILRQLSTVAQ